MASFAKDIASKENEYRQAVFDKVHNNLNAHAATWMAQLDCPFFNVPAGTLCTFIADNDMLTIHLKTIPQKKLELPLSHIHRFQYSLVKKIETAAVGVHHITKQQETYRHVLYLEYRNQFGSVINASFISGNTYEDKLYNKEAFRTSNIFTYINARIHGGTNRN